MGFGRHERIANEPPLLIDAPAEADETALPYSITAFRVDAHAGRTSERTLRRVDSRDRARSRAPVASDRSEAAKEADRALRA